MKRLLALGGTAALALATVLVPGTAHAATASHIAFVRGGNIFIANSNGTGVKQITNTGLDSQPVIRGNKIVFTRSGYIWTMLTSGANQWQWFAGHGASFSPGSTSSVSYIANMKDSSCSWQEVRTQALSDGSTPTLLASTQSDCVYDTFGPTTAWVTTGVIYSWHHQSCCDNQADPDQVAIISTSGNRPGYWWEYGTAPAVASNNSLVAFTSSIPTHHRAVHVYTVPATGNSQTAKQMGTDAGVQTPTFSPDGKYMLWTQGSKIREYNVATKKTITLVANGGLSPSWG